jgi:ABC-type nitrate/sulfonate/bicarbonate transport system substrate-binding protein
VRIGDVVEKQVPNTAIVTIPAIVAERSETLRRFIRALAQGVELYERQPDVADRAIANFFALDLAENRPAIEDTRRHYAPMYTALPYPPVEGYRDALKELAGSNPRAASFRLEGLLDDRFVRELESGAAAAPAFAQPTQATRAAAR